VGPGWMVAARRAAALIAILAACASAAWAHDVPVDVKVNMFVKPAGNRLELLIRVPMVALQEVEFPTRGPGYLDLSRADDALRNATKLWLIDNIDIYENNARLPPPRITAVRVSLPSDRSFTSYDEALAHVQGPRLADTLDLYWNQQLLDVLLEYPIGSDRSAFAIHPRVDRFAERVQTALRFLPPDGAVRAFEFHGDPGLVRLDPSWHQAAWRFGVSGFWHILEGIDHLLFLLCLVLPYRRLKPLVILVTSFTLAHSISLIAAAFGFVPDALWFVPLIETLIAATIVFMALENIVGSRIERRWVFAFAFGIVHGFGFSFLLRDSLQFAGDHLVTSLLAFNVGVEVGQLVVLLVLIPALGWLFRHAVAERLGIIIISAFVAHTGWHWLTERGGELMQFPFPTIDAAFLASAMRGLMAALILAGIVMLVGGRLRRWLTPEPELPLRESSGTWSGGRT
jgi:HupE / UreJ protein